MIRSGFLTIDEGESGWKRYWFVLSGSTVGDVALRYYTHTEAARDGPAAAMGTLLLKGCRVVVIQEMIRITAEEDAEEWFVCADSAQLGQQWSEDIELASRAPDQCEEAAGGWGQGVVVRESALLRGGAGGGVRSSLLLRNKKKNTRRRRMNSERKGSEEGPGSDVGEGRGEDAEVGRGSALDPPESDGQDAATVLSPEERKIRRRQIIELLHQRHDEFVMCFGQCDFKRLREITANGGLQNSTIRSLIWLRLLGSFPEDLLVDDSDNEGGGDEPCDREQRPVKRKGQKNEGPSHGDVFASWAQSVKDHRDEYVAIRNSVLVSSKDVGSRVSAEVDGAARAAKRAPSTLNSTAAVGAAVVAGGSQSINSNAPIPGRQEINASPSPLSEDTAGAIFQYLVKSDFARQIWKDVTRTQQTIAWFVEAETQELMHRILLVWSLAHQDVGYKQGMNELLAVLLYLICTERGGLGGEGHAELRQEVQTDRVDRPEGENAQPFQGQEEVHDILDSMLDPAYCEHDAYMLFSLIMGRMEGVFCPVGEAPSAYVPVVSPASTDQASSVVRRRKRTSATSLLQRFSRIQAEIVHLQDPDLAEHMIMQGVEPHMYLLRWMRLLCCREFAMPGLWSVWDAIIAVDPQTFEFNDFICAALVLSLSDPIMQQEDAQGILQELQHFNKGFNIDIMRLLDLARTIKTRLTGRLLDPVHIHEV